MPRTKRPAAEVDRLIAMWREGVAGKEIAERLDWPPGTVATWVRRLQRSGALSRRTRRRLIAPSAAIPSRALQDAIAAMPAEDREAREAELTGRPREVYLARRDGRTLAEIGALYSHNREWARQVEFAALVEIVGGKEEAKRIADDAAAAKVADEEIIELRRQGHTVPQVCEALGIGVWRVRRVSRAAGLSRRDIAKALAKARRLEVARRKEAGESHAEIAEALGVSAFTVTKDARRLGLAGKRRPRRMWAVSRRKGTREDVAAHPDMPAKDLAKLLGVHVATIHRHRRLIAEEVKRG